MPLPVRTTYSILRWTHTNFDILLLQPSTRTNCLGAGHIGGVSSYGGAIQDLLWAGDSPRPSLMNQLYPHAEEDGPPSSNGDINPADESIFVPKKQLHIEVPPSGSNGSEDKSGLSPGSSAKHARSHAEFASSTKGDPSPHSPPSLPPSAPSGSFQHLEPIHNHIASVQVFAR